MKTVILALVSQKVNPRVEPMMSSDIYKHAGLIRMNTGKNVSLQKQFIKKTKKTKLYLSG